jgi:hypothetical protein
VAGVIEMLAQAYGPTGFESTDWIVLGAMFAVFVLVGIAISLTHRAHSQPH